MTFRWNLSIAAVLTAAVAACAPAVAQPSTAAPVEAPVDAPTSAAPRPSPSPPGITYPARGHGNWTYAPAAATGTAGSGGKLMRYRVAVESDVAGLTPAAFARAVGATLGGPGGWTTGGQWRFRQVGADDPHDFTVYLTTPGTRDQLCGDHPDGYTSCRNGERVILNVARWVKGVPGYGASLAMYRAYMVNHEVGHRLGHGHERCPGPGRPAPVMQQQTLGLHGCTANPLPYRDGRRYAGPAGEYGDHVPPPDRGRGPGK